MPNEAKHISVLLNECIENRQSAGIIHALRSMPIK